MGDLMFYGVLGVVVGGRLGFVLFYGFDTFLDDPLWLFRIWEGGMSFHGGLLGVVGVAWFFARRTSRGFLEVTDFAAPLAPVGLGLGRLGNFINAELPGRVTELPFGMRFPCESVRDLNLVCFGGLRECHPARVEPLPGCLGRRPAVLDRLVVFRQAARGWGRSSGVFLLGYGGLRLLTEFAREPDPEKGFVAFAWMTLGQLLSLPMIVGGVALLFLHRNLRQTLRAP